jgi:hydrogenase-4 component H
VPDTWSGSYRGLPKYDGEACVGCGACVQVCPSGAIEQSDDRERKVRTLSVDYGSCIQCGQCQEHCITGKGIVNTTAYSLAVADVRAPEMREAVEKELTVCEACGAVIGCRDHLRWVMDRLGARAYAHPNFILLTQARLTDVAPARPKSRFRREDQMMVVCAKCRQKIVTSDEFRLDHAVVKPLEIRKITEGGVMLTVKNILEAKGVAVWTTTPEAKVFDALKTMADKGVGALVVVDKGKIAGLLSERDYARKVVLHGKTSPKTPVREIMTSPVFCVKFMTTAQECMALMTDKHIRHLPVVEEDKLVGLVSIGDVVKSVISEHQITINHLQDYIVGKYL